MRFLQSDTPLGSSRSIKQEFHIFMIPLTYLCQVLLLLAGSWPMADFTMSFPSRVRLSKMLAMLSEGVELKVEVINTWSEFQQVSSLPSNMYCLPYSLTSLLRTELTLKMQQKADEMIVSIWKRWRRKFCFVAKKWREIFSRIFLMDIRIFPND